VIIDWGDTPPEVYDISNIYNSSNIILTSTSQPLLGTYTHEYFPSSYALYKSLFAQILVNYSNGNYCWFIIPIKIRTYDYFESIYDMTLINTNILPSERNLKEHQFITAVGGYSLETISN